VPWFVDRYWIFSTALIVVAVTVTGLKTQYLDAVDVSDDLGSWLTLGIYGPETGNTGVGGGAYLLLDACPGCGGGPHARGDVPMAAITGLAHLGNYQHTLRLHLDPPPVPVEFFDDPAHAPDCPLRSPITAPHNTEHDSTERDGQE
jgi:hypothetical protein